MPSFTPMSLIKRYDGKPDIHSRAIKMICDVAMNGVGPHFACKSRHNRTILRVLMTHTGWNMVLVGKIPTDTSHDANIDADLWAETINIATECELEEKAPRVEKVIVCEEGIMVRFVPGDSWGTRMNKTTQKRLQKVITETATRFSGYDSWGATLLRPVVAEE